MADEDVGEPELLLELYEQVDDLGLDGDVESRDRLVADDDLRLEDDGAGNADALALATRELVRIAVLELEVEADGLHDLLDAGIAFCLRLVGTCDIDRLCDDVRDGHARIQGAIGVLEDELHLLACLRERLSLERREILAVEDDLARRGLREAQDALAGRRLATAGLADDSKRLAAVQLERDILEGMHDLVGVSEHTCLHRIVLRQMLDLEHDSIAFCLAAHASPPSMHRCTSSRRPCGTRRRRLPRASGTACGRCPLQTGTSG